MSVSNLVLTSAGAYITAGFDASGGIAWAKLWRKQAGEGYGLIRTWTTPVDPSPGHDDYNIEYNITYTYQVTDSDGNSTSEVTCTSWSDTFSDAVTTTDVSTNTIAVVTTSTDTVTMTDVSTNVVSVVSTSTETVTVTDALLDSQTIRTNFAYYLASADGKVYVSGDDQYGDAGSSITAEWRSKRLDFSDQYPQFYDNWKTLYLVRLRYMDLEAVDVAIYVSTDGGVNWTSKTKSIGSGAGTLKEADFYFIKTGRFFDFKVEHASATTKFQWTELQAEFVPAGEYFSV